MAKKNKLVFVLIIILSILLGVFSQFTHKDGTEKIKASYNLKDGFIIDRNVKVKYMEIWERTKAIFPDEYEKIITKFSIISDGKGGTLAAVQSIDSSNKFFELSVDHIDAFDDNGELTDDEEFLFTLIHEYSHIVSLESSQFQEVGEFKGNTLIIEEGATKENSYLNQFYKKFWSHLSKEVDKISQNQNNPSILNELSTKIYTASPDSFVTPYSASSPVEDFAETFAFFVIQDKPLGKTIKEEKILFFYDFEKFVQLRNIFRENIENIKQTFEPI